MHAVPDQPTPAPPAESPPPRTPRGLGARGRRLWKEIVDEFGLDRRELEVLDLACRTADDVDRLTAELATAELWCTGSKGQQVVNPLVREVRDARAAFARLLSALELPGEAESGGWDNLTASQRARKAARARWGGR